MATVFAGAAWPSAKQHVHRLLKMAAHCVRCAMQVRNNVQCESYQGSQGLHGETAYQSLQGLACPASLWRPLAGQLPSGQPGSLHSLFVAGSLQQAWALTHHRLPDPVDEAMLVSVLRQGIDSIEDQQVCEPKPSRDLRFRASVYSWMHP